MEQLAARVVRRLADELAIDKEREEIAAFGLLSALSNGAILIGLTVIALATDLVGEIAAASLVGAVFRRTTGGAHFHRPWRCIVATLILNTLLGYFGLVAARWIPATITGYWLLILGVMLGGLYPLLRFAPADTPENPLSETLRRQFQLRGRRLWVATLVVGVVAALVGPPAGWLYSGLLAFLLQVFSVTPGGYFIYGFLERGFEALEKVTKGGGFAG